MSTQDVAVRAELDAKRTATIAAIFELALLLEQNPDLPIPYELGNGSSLTIHLLSSADPRGDLARIVRILPGSVDKRAWDAGGTSYFDVTAKVGGVLPVRISAFRDQVCERVVTGTREVTKTIPDPAVVVPVVEVTETVEDVEWICGPLMREQVSQ